MQCYLNTNYLLILFVMITYVFIAAVVLFVISFVIMLFQKDPIDL